MMKEGFSLQDIVLKDVTSAVEKNRRKSIWKRIVSFLACIVVFCTTYALILPALTMERPAECGIEEHTHTEACYIKYDTGSADTLVCAETLGLHVHTADCIGMDGAYICGYSDFVIHSHNQFCFDESGMLVCTLPEILPHIHSDFCYPASEDIGFNLPAELDGAFDGNFNGGVNNSLGHIHTDECYITEPGELICALGEDAEIHVHTDECYAQNRVLVCEIPEEPFFVDGGSALPFPDGEDDGWLTEQSPENYIPEDAIINNTAEGGRLEPVCGIPEIIPHTHTDSCFDGNGILICGMTEVLEHIHTQYCMGKPDDSDELTCTIAEGEGAHIHTVESGCFGEDGTLICGLEESEGHVHSAICYGNWILACGIEEHTHTDECYSSDEPEADPARIAYCGREEHIHAGECINDNGVVVCLIEEHKHTEECYADASAEPETFCGRTEHVHADECFDENGVLICALEEHVHGYECYTEISEEEILNALLTHSAVAYIVGYDTFDDFGIMMLADGAGSEEWDHDFAQFIKLVQMQYKDGNNGWKDVPPGYKIGKDETIAFNIKYNLPGGKLTLDYPYMTYQLPGEYLILEQQKGKVDNTQGVTVGEYIIDTNGLITIKFNDAFVKNNMDNHPIEGFIRAEAKVDSSKVTEDNNTLHFADDCNIKIEIDDTEPDNSDVRVTKSSSPENGFDADGCIEYTLTVKSNNGTKNPVILTDEMTEHLELAGDITVTGADGNSYTVTNTEKGFIIDLPQMSSGGEYTVTYKAKLKDKYKDSTVDIYPGNRVNVSSKGEDGKGPDGYDYRDTKVVQTYLSKDGEVSGESIKWTITVNEGKHDINGWTLSDAFNGVDLSGKEVDMICSDGTTKKVTLPYKFTSEDDTTGTYTITYETDIVKPIGGNSPINKAELTSPDGDKATAEKPVGLPDKPLYDPLEKQKVSFDTTSNPAIAEWKVVIDGKDNGILGQWCYEDILWNGQYMTEDQINDLKDAVAKASNGKDIKLDPVWTNGQITGFKLTADKLEKGERIEFTYKSTVPIANPDVEQTFWNDGLINGYKKNASVTYYPNYPIVVKYDTNDWNKPNTEHDYYQLNGIVKWTVQAAPPKDYNGGNFVVIENLPDGVDVQRLELRTKLYDNIEYWNDIKNDGTHIVNYNNALTVNKSQDGRTITLTISEELAKMPNLKFFDIYIETKIQDTYEYDANHKGTFKNNVAVKYENGDELGTAEQTQVITRDDTKPPIEKAAGTISNNKIPYSITINPDGLDLLEGSDKLTLIDTLTYNVYNGKTGAVFSIVPGSVKVYELVDGVKGEQLDIKDFPYHIDSVVNDLGWGNTTKIYTITMSVPDKRALVVEYTYLVKYEGGIGETLYDIKNKARLDGVAEGVNESDTSVSITIEQSSSGADTNGITLLKVDSENDGILLSGAEFELYKYSKESDCYIKVTKDDDGNPIRLKSDSFGAVNIQASYNTAYYIIETKAPEGYLLNEKPYYFVINNDDKDIYPPVIPDNFSGEYLSGGYQFYFPNENALGKIEVEKQWLEDKTGKNVTSTRTGDIQFNLMRYVLDEKPGSKPSLISVKTSVFSWGFGNIPTYFDPVNVPYGSDATITVNIPDGAGDDASPVLRINGEYVAWEKINDNNTLYYSFKVTDNVHIEVNRHDYRYAGMDANIFKPIITEPLPAELKHELVEILTISSETGWRTTITDLPKTGQVADGSGGTKTVYYAYYVEEITDGITDMVGDPVYSENNSSGITTGTITIANTVDIAPKHELPKTGGSGTTKFLSAGAGLMLIALLALLRKSKISAGGVQILLNDLHPLFAKLNHWQMA